MSSTGTGKLRLNFNNLPLVDAAVRASFASPLQLTFGSINHLAERLRGDFPQLAELDQFQFPPGVRDPSLTLSPSYIPGAKYTGNPAGLEIAVQNQVIVARWSRRFGSSAPDYPRYPALADTLWRAVDCLRDTSRQTLPPIVVVNMSYVNFIQVRHNQRVLEQYFSEQSYVQTPATAHKIHRVELSWQESSGLDLRLSLDQAAADVLQTKVEGFQLTTAAGQRIAPDAMEREALDVIHDRLQEFFLGILTDHAKAEWGLEPIHD